MEEKILATVEGKAITNIQLDGLIQQAPQDQQNQFRTHEGHRQLLNEMIAQELFYLEGKKEKIEETQDFKKEFEEMKEKFLKSYMISHFMGSVSVEEKEVKDYYDAHPKEFIAPDSIRASHILLPAEQQAKDIINEINNGDKSFEDAAKAYSICPSKDVGDDLNYFSKGKMVPEFEKVAFALKVGEMTDKPIKTEFGWHIIKITDSKSGETIPYDVVKDSLHHFLLGQKQNHEYMSEVEELKKSFKVEYKTGI